MSQDSGPAPAPPAPGAAGNFGDGLRNRTTRERGHKRTAEDAPDDPRTSATEDAEVVDDGNRDTSIIGHDCEHRCGEFEEEFESRNQLFEHMREKDHMIESDEGEKENTKLDEDVNELAADRKIPGARTSTKHIKPKDLVWRDIGSGTMSKTFVGATRYWTTTKNGPPIEDVHLRRTWSLTSGKLIDECEVDMVTDEVLRRPLPEPDDIRVELVMKGAQDMYMRPHPDVVEVYSNPRVCQEATSRKYEGLDLRPGWSLDLTTKDPSTGNPWDLSCPKVQAKVRKMVRETQPYCIVGSPPCTPFSQLQGLNNFRRDPIIVGKELELGKRHIRFCLELYEIQLRGNRHFVHEHPAGSTAWKMTEMQQFILTHGTETVITNMCSFGMTAKDEQGEGLVCKPTKIMSSSEEVLKRIRRPCTGGHRHVHLISGKAKAAQVYPRAFCRAICEGRAAQKNIDDLGVEARPIMSVEEMATAAKTNRDQNPSEELHETYGKDVVAHDDLTGEVLNPILMSEARKEEIKYFKEMGVYDKVPIE